MKCGKRACSLGKNIGRACRDAIEKAKAHLEFNLPKKVKDNKKGSLKYVNRKRKQQKMSVPY